MRNEDIHGLLRIKLGVVACISRMVNYDIISTRAAIYLIGSDILNRFFVVIAQSYSHPHIAKGVLTTILNTHLLNIFNIECCQYRLIALLHTLRKGDMVVVGVRMSYHTKVDHIEQTVCIFRVEVNTESGGRSLYDIAHIVEQPHSNRTLLDLCGAHLFTNLFERLTQKIWHSCLLQSCNFQRIAFIAIVTPILSFEAIDYALSNLHSLQSFWGNIVTIGLIHKGFDCLTKLLVGRHLRHLNYLRRYGNYRQDQHQ